jgi:hypothetical protein
MRQVLAVALVSSTLLGAGVGCGSTGSSAPPEPRSLAGSAVAQPAVAPAPAPSPVSSSETSDGHAPSAALQVEQAPVAPTPPGHDFTAVGHALFAVGACGDSPAPEGFPEKLLAAHCAEVRRVQADYKARWVDRARAFFAEKVPAGLPKKVVYPFAGGDLSTALTVYPDADEITTLSLEPAGDPRTLAVLTSQSTGRRSNEGTSKGSSKGTSNEKANEKAIERALSTIRSELGFLYRVNFSNTMNLIGAMRAGELPTQLVFGLSALAVHGFEVVSLRYFSLAEDGSIVYLTDEDVAAAPDVSKGKASARNRVFANAEIGFRRPGGRVQIYRHLQVNLDDDHTTKDPRVLRHLADKGEVAGMTKAASYLLSWPSFSSIRDYLLDHVVWMVSDATGVPPKYGKERGFEYETYGRFKTPHIGGGQEDWRAEWEAQPSRALAFRFGYYDGSAQHTNHLVIMRKPAR